MRYPPMAWPSWYLARGRVKSELGRRFLHEFARHRAVSYRKVNVMSAPVVPSPNSGPATWAAATCKKVLVLNHPKDHHVSAKLRWRDTVIFTPVVLMTVLVTFVSPQYSAVLNRRK
jgi:hypothetical protein